jgi:hypothetical protein
MFEGVEFRGTVDRFRQERKRMYYHVTYTDGDEEEYTQTELRDGHVLGLSEEMEREWAKFKSQTSNEKEVSDSSESDDFSSDKSSDEEIPKPPQKKRKENAKSSKKKTNKSNKTKQVSGKDALSDQLLPLTGSKNVTSEAYAKLTIEQQDIVAANIDLKTKKVYFKPVLCNCNSIDILLCFDEGGKSFRERASVRCRTSRGRETKVASTINNRNNPYFGHESYRHLH